MTDLNITSHKIIAIDLPSHAKSESFTVLSLDLYVEVIKKLIDSLNIKKVVLCGHSLGGAVIQAYFYKYTNDVEALILLATGGRLRVSSIILDAIKNNFQEYLDSVLLGAFHRKTSKDIINNLVKETSKMEPQVIYNDFKICDNFNMLDKVKSIDVPCLIICANSDKLTPIKYSQYFHDNIKESQIVIIKDAGHMIMLEKPNEINKAIQDFFENYLKKK